MKKINIFVFAIMALMLSACTSAALKVTSTPEKAEVWISSEREQPQKVGETPLYIDRSSISKGAGKQLTVKIQKDGFLPETVVMPISSMGDGIEISAKLSESKAALMCSNQGASFEKLAKGVANVQLLLSRNQYGEARGQLSSLLSDFPEVSVLHDLMGNVHYLSKNLEAAKISYQRSVDLNPNNPDTRRMLDRLSGIIESRLPASQGGN